MKKLIFAVLILTGFLLTAQDGDFRQRQWGKSDMTPQQMATIKTKHLTLALDLTEGQQQLIQKLNLEEAKLIKSRQEMRAAQKKEGTKPSPEERYERHLAHLDDMIAHKAKMKTVLNQEQYEKWERLSMHMKMQHRPKKRERPRPGR